MLFNWVSVSCQKKADLQLAVTWQKTKQIAVDAMFAGKCEEDIQFESQELPWHLNAFLIAYFGHFFS